MQAEINHTDAELKAPQSYGTIIRSCYLRPENNQIRAISMPARLHNQILTDCHKLLSAACYLGIPTKDALYDDGDGLYMSL